MKLLRRHLRRFSGPRPNYRAAPADEREYCRRMMAASAASQSSMEMELPTAPSNCGLLYIIHRIATDLRPDTVLKIGVGPGTLLLDRLHRHGTVGRVTSLEHDPAVAEVAGQTAGHEILVTSLRVVRIGSIQTLTYDWDEVRSRGPFDVIVCDGPEPVGRYSRYGILEMLDASLPADFTLVLDDVDQPGEQDTVGAIHDRLRQLGRPYETSIIRAASTQVVFALGSHAAMWRD